MIELDDILEAIARGDAARVARASAAEVNGVDVFGRAPLMHAALAKGDDAAVLSALLARGANPNLVERGEDWTPLHVAARDGKTARLRALLEAGAEVEALDVYGNTPLWRSIMSGRTDLSIPRMLLRYGADPHRKNRYGVSPLDLAEKTARDDIVALFEDAAGSSKG